MKKCPSYEKVQNALKNVFNNPLLLLKERNDLIQLTSKSNVTG